MTFQSSNHSTSIWHASSSIPRFPRLEEEYDADVCVIGAGIAGLTTAYLLSGAGKSVVVIDAAHIGAGESGRTTAHFFPPDEHYFQIESNFGKENAALVADSYRKAADLVELIVQSENIECQFERLPGYLFAGEGKNAAELDQEYAAAQNAQLDVQRVDQVPGLSFSTGRAVQFSHQAQFHPLRYLNGLARAIISNGGHIFDETRALSISGKLHDHVIHTPRAQIKAGAVVVATNTPFNDRVVMHTKQAGYMSYVIGVRVPKNSVPRVLLWDTGDPYHYVRLQPSENDRAEDILLVGGEDHKVGQDEHPEHRYRVLEAWVRQRFPMAAQVVYRWSGQVMEPADGLAFLGRNPMDDKNIYVITGDSGNGMTHCTAGAMIVADLILGRANAWAELYAPSRKPVHGVAEFVKEQANTLAQYGDWFQGGEVESADEIPAGQGALLRDGAKQLAVYRDDQGDLHVLSAVCTHLGGIVSWNPAEKSWDCPCHASRFEATGEVLHGPAITALERATLNEKYDAPLKPGVSHERPEVR